jgi:hypothetical protein
MYSSVQGKPNLHGICDAVYVLVLDMSSLAYLADIPKVVQFSVHLPHHIWVYCLLRRCKITWCHSYWITEMVPWCSNNEQGSPQCSIQKSKSVIAMLPGKWIDRAVLWTWPLRSADLTPLDSRKMWCLKCRCLHSSLWAAATQHKGCKKVAVLNMEIIRLWLDICRINKGAHFRHLFVDLRCLLI